MLRTIAATALVLAMFTGSAIAWDDGKAKCFDGPKSDRQRCITQAIDDLTTPKPGEPYFIQPGGGAIIPQSLVCRNSSRENCLKVWDNLTKNLPSELVGVGSSDDPGESYFLHLCLTGGGTTEQCSTTFRGLFHK